MHHALDLCNKVACGRQIVELRAVQTANTVALANHLKKKLK
jgi:hypothetical protein